MSGSSGQKQVGFRPGIPVLTLLLPVLVLLWGLGILPGSLSAVSASPPAEPSVGDALLAADGSADTFAEATLVAAAFDEDGGPALAAGAQSPTARTTPLATPTPTAVAPPAITPTPQPTWGGPDTFTFVALGVDQRNTKEIPRTDTIMIGRVDLKTPRVSLVSVPRDLLVDIPGYGKDRINTAYVYGEMYTEPGGGIGLLRRTIEKSFGVKVDHFGMVDFQCFRTAVDAVGGVTVNVPRAIVDPHYPTEDYGTKLVTFEPGVQKMDGERALEYARTRYADNDFQRMQRQQLIIAAMREQLFDLRTLPAVPTVLSGCTNMRSDLGWREYLTLATSLRTLDKSRITFAAVDHTMVSDAILSSGAAVLLPRWEPIRALMAANLGVGAPTIGAAGASTASAGAAVRGVAAPSPTPGLLAPTWPSPVPVASPAPPAPGGSVAHPWPADRLPDEWVDAAAPVDPA